MFCELRLRGACIYGMIFNHPPSQLGQSLWLRIYDPKYIKETGHQQEMNKVLVFRLR